MAALVLAVGILGVASLQVATLKNNHVTYLTSQAVTYLEKMRQMMNANQAAATAGNYAFSFSAAEPPEAPGYVCDENKTCTSAELATWQIYEWGNALINDTKLPAVEASAICMDTPCTANSQYQLSLAWDDDRDGLAANSDDDPLLTMQVRP